MRGRRLLLPHPAYGRPKDPPTSEKVSDGAVRRRQGGPREVVSKYRCIVRDTNTDFVGSFRKEVIQPQVPLRLPCYDFTPVADPTVDGCLQLPG